MSCHGRPLLLSFLRMPYQTLDVDITNTRTEKVVLWLLVMTIDNILQKFGEIDNVRCASAVSNRSLFDI